MVWNLLLLGLFGILILLALFGNLLVCAAIIWDRGLRQQPENLFLVSLAISDLLVSVLVMVFAAGNDVLDYWPFGQVYCQFWVAFDITCSTASILNLCAISSDRYWHISRSMSYARYCNRRRIICIIVIVWLASALIGSAPLFLGVGSVTPSNVTGLPVCEIKMPLGYAIGSSMLSFFMPAAIMVYLYSKLYMYARRHVRSIKTQLQQATSFLIMQLASDKIREVTAATLMTDSLLVPSADRNEGPLNVSPATEEESIEIVKPRYEFRRTVLAKVSRFFPRARTSNVVVSEGRAVVHATTNVSDQKARLTLGVIMGTFLLCWLPFFLVNIGRAYRPDAFNANLILAVTWLGYANSAANPLIYSIFNRDFRRAFKKILTKSFNCLNTPDGSINDHYNHNRKRYESSSQNENNNDPQAARLLTLNNN